MQGKKDNCKMPVKIDKIKGNMFTTIFFPRSVYSGSYVFWLLLQMSFVKLNINDMQCIVIISYYILVPVTN